MNNCTDWMNGTMDPGLLGCLMQAIRAYQHVGQMQAAIAKNEDDQARLERIPGGPLAQQGQLETLRLHTSIMREHLDRRLEPAQQRALRQLLAALDEAGLRGFRDALHQLAEHPSATRASGQPL
jgi:hypothetical protein